MIDATTYDVRINKTEVYTGKRSMTYWVRWVVAGQRFKEPFRTSTLADSFRSDLVAASRKGEAFEVLSGLPVSMARAQRHSTTWYTFACEYVDMKWQGASGNYRKSLAEALTTITEGMFSDDRGKPDDALLRKALRRWAFNKTMRARDDIPDDVREALRWVERNTRPVVDLTKSELGRAILDRIARRLDGKPSAATVVRRKRAVLTNVIGYAIERKLLVSNPMSEIKWKAPTVSHEVDRRSVANPIQARTLLRELGQLRGSGPRLVAFFALMYYAALRPEEVINVKLSNLTLPPLVWNEEKGEWVEPADNWCRIELDFAAPEVGVEWTDSGTHREERQLKHRAKGATRPVPGHPELTTILRDHIRKFGTGQDGRLFVGKRADEVPRITYGRIWDKARRAAFSPTVYASTLAKTPYSLRHACVSTWLNGGVAPTQVAAWAGHSVEVLHRVYAKCLDGQEQQALRRVEAALRGE